MAGHVHPESSVTMPRNTQLTKPRPLAKASKAKGEPLRIELAPDDYRRALLLAKTDGNTVFSHLTELGAACRLDELLNL